MKASIAPAITTASSAEKTTLLAAFLDLTKFRLTSLVLLTTLVGYYIGAHGRIDFLLMLNTVLGTGLVASGAAALNQLLERDHDALMKRTRTRPLPAGRLQPETALLFGALSAGLGLIYLAMQVNALASLLAAATLISYLFVYTPLKRVTWLNTLVGAVPGALPPLIGWTAARGAVTIEGWTLFGILFFWQLPHFMAIAWIYREEYERAGFAMLSVFDPEGKRTGRQAILYTLGLLPISLCPAILGLTGMLYFAGALVLSLTFLWFAVLFSRRLTRDQARKLFYVSIVYLPVLLGLMVFDKVR